LAREVERLGFDVSVGSSGTIEAIAQLANAARPDAAPLRSLTNATFTRKEAEAVVRTLAGASHRRGAPRHRRHGAGSSRHHLGRRHHRRAGH